MERHMISSEQSTVQIQDNNPGCMWGMLQVLDYQRWRVKKVFPHKNKKHARYKRKAISYNQSEGQQYGHTEAEPPLVGKHSEKLSAASKSSPHNRKKEPHTEKRFNEENSEGSSTTMEKNGKTIGAALNHKHMETDELDRNISNKSEKHSDVSELFRVEKDLLLEFLRDLDVGGKKFHQASHKKARLTKSGSFPLPSTSQVKTIRSSSLKHKQSEIWAIPKGEKLLDGISFEKPMPLVSDLGVDSAKKQKSTISSKSSQGSNHKGWNQLVLHQFKVIKHKIKHALGEFRKSSNQTSTVTEHHRASPEYSINNNEQEISQSSDGGEIQEYKNNKHDVPLMRRTSSLNESMDRYTQLFEKSFSKDVKWKSSMSRSLKLTNEDNIHKSGYAHKFSRSNLSMPNFETIGFILHEALFDTYDIGNTMESDNHAQRKSGSLAFKIDGSHDHFKGAEIVETVEGNGRDVNRTLLSDKITEKIDEGVTCDQKEDRHEPAIGDGSFPQEKKEMSMITNLNKEIMASLEPSFEDNTTNHAEGKELKTRGSSLDELESDLSYKGSVYYSLSDSLSNTNASVTAKDTDKSSDNHFLLFKSDTANNYIFNYVKDVLEFSGFLGNEHNQMRYTVDQPLKPSLFKDLDATLRHEIESSGEETINPYDHQLLFNLVNEVLLEMYETSPAYFRRPFFLNYLLHPMPKGNYLLNKVWTGVNSYLSLRPELDQTLDDVVGRDLAKRSGWMILQQEEECVALELEEMIIEDLLDELIFS